MQKRFVVYLLSFVFLPSFSCTAFFPDDSDREFELIRKEIMNGFSSSSNIRLGVETETLEQQRDSLKQQLARVENKIEQNKKITQKREPVAQFNLPKVETVALDKSGGKVYRVSMELPDSFKEEGIKVKVTQKDKEQAQLIITATSTLEKGEKTTEGETQFITHTSMQSFSRVFSTHDGSQALTVNSKNGETQVNVTLDLPSSVQTTILSKKLMSLIKNKSGNTVTLRIELPVKPEDAKNGTELEFEALAK